MVVIPADQEGVDPQDAINDTFVLVIHILNLRKKRREVKKSLVIWETLLPLLTLLGYFNERTWEV